MIINSSALEALYYNFRMDFKSAFERTASWGEKVATTIPSSTSENRYVWARQLPSLRKWIGERKVHGLEGRSYSIVNEKYESTVAVKKEDLEDDNIGFYPAQIQTMGMEAKRWPDQLIASLIKAGTTSLAYDGQPFFNASHPIDVSGGGGTYSNLMAATPLNAANYAAARAAMMSYVNENGDSLSVTPSLLVVPPQLELAARQILQAEFIVASAGINGANGGQTNVLRNSADLLVVPELAGEADAWYLIDATKPIKPFVFQMRKAPEMVALTSATSENVFWRSEFVYGVEARGAAGFSLPFLALRAKA